MNRRGFVKALAGGAIGWFGVGRIADGSSYADPVQLVADAGLSGVDQQTAMQLLTIDASRTTKLQAATFPQSVASGDPRPHGIVLWTRIDPTQQTDETPNAVGWQIALSSDFKASDLVLEGVAVIRAEHDNTVKLSIQDRSLVPFHGYYYRFIFNGVASRTGQFKTLPAADADIQLLRIGYVVCQDYSNGFYTAYAGLAQEDVDYVVHLGDYIYEYLNDGVGGPNNGPVRVVPDYPSGGQYPQTIDDYRHLYKTYRADLNQQAVHERFAMILLWDDHEFFNDCHQDYHEDTNPPGLSATTPQPALRAAANQAWVEHGLADVAFYPTLGWQFSVKVYRNFRFGKLMDLVVTDERLYRDGPPCGDVDIGERYETHGCAEQSDPARTMLGPLQKEWFLDTVTQSAARWKLWANEVMLCQYILEGEFFDLDQWDGYPAERASILSTIRDKNVSNFVVLSGDAHLFLASYLKPDFNDLTQAPVAVEFLVGAISSGNYLDAGVDKPAPLSAPAAAVKASGMGLPADALEPLILSENPHMVFWNGSTWGYGILTITPEQLVCEYRIVSTVKQPTATVSTLATFTVPNGQVKMIAS